MCQRGRVSEWAVTRGAARVLLCCRPTTPRSADQGHGAGAARSCGTRPRSRERSSVLSALSDPLDLCLSFSLLIRAFVLSFGSS